MFSDIFILYLRKSLEIPNYYQYQLLNFGLKKRERGEEKEKRKGQKEREREGRKERNEKQQNSS